MEFAGLGTVSYDTPSEEMRPFMRKKMTGWVNTWRNNKDGLFYRSDIQKEEEKYAKTLPEELREKATKERTELFTWAILCDKPGESIKYEEIIETWVSRVHAAPDERKENMEKTKKAFEILFNYMDLNKDGFINFEEYRKANQILREETIKGIFDVLDANKDGLISLEEYLYAGINFIFGDDPNSPYKHVFNL